MESKMPGGNSTARPHNRKEREAVKLSNDAMSLAREIVRKQSSGEFSEAGAGRLLDTLYEPGGRVMDAERTLLGRRRKAIERERRAKAGMAKGGKIKKKAGVAKGGKIKKMARGGTCRGMGAATKGGNYRAR